MPRLRRADAERDAWRRVARLLCVRLDAMGDVLMTTPALRAAKESAPRHITLLTSPGGAEAARLVPDVDDVLVYEAPWVKATPARSDANGDRELIARLAAMRFDAAVIFTVYSQNPLPAAMVCYLAGIPRRLAHCRENPYQLLTDWAADFEPAGGVRHEVRRQLDLVARVGWRTSDERLRLAVPPAAAARVDAMIATLGLDLGPWAVVHPGASAPSRRYAPERFAAVIRALARDHGWRIALTGTGEEAPLLESLRGAGGNGAVSLAGALDLAELGALIARAPLLISNNTGPVHVAAAVGTPVVDLYALTNPQHTPWRVPSRVLYHDVPCRTCYRSVCPEGHHLCLDGVPPARVVAAAVDLARAGRAAPAGDGLPVAAHDAPGSVSSLRTGAVARSAAERPR
ncbi:MAG TPA: glycosyltransferase family 9 protein [Gammaproteobacteria bacterium]